MKSALFYSIVLFFALVSNAQVILDANGAGNTYEEISAVLAPGYDAVEEVCNHTDFNTDGRHIDEIYDNTLGDDVFRFTVHVTPDNNKCVDSDRQRNEIKTYNQSPDNLKGIVGETVEYKWKFKLHALHQSSGDFTHIHQLKSVGADSAEESQPLITLTTRYKDSWGATPHRIELRFAPYTSASSLIDTDITPFLGEWVEVTETVTFGEDGSGGGFNIEIKRISDNATLFSYFDSSIRMWKTNADFIRPKWGIYRKNDHDPVVLRDEEILFANFSITEGVTLGSKELIKDEHISIFPNPANDLITINSSKTVSDVVLYSILGKEIEYNRVDNKIDVSSLKPGIYMLNVKTVSGFDTIKKFVVN